MYWNWKCWQRIVTASEAHTTWRYKCCKRRNYLKWLRGKLAMERCVPLGFHGKSVFSYVRFRPCTWSPYKQDQGIVKGRPGSWGKKSDEPGRAQENDFQGYDAYYDPGMSSEQPLRLHMSQLQSRKLRRFHFSKGLGNCSYLWPWLQMKVQFQCRQVIAVDVQIHASQTTN